jgi:hypothetical protein
MSTLRRVLRALAGPFLMSSRFDQLVALLERRLDKIEQGPLRSVLDRQQHIDQRFDALSRDQDRLRRLVAGEELADDDRPRAPFGGPLPVSI